METPGGMNFYSEMAATRDDASDLQECVRRTTQRLERIATSTERPGMLLGRVQAGKTRAFLGIIASAFDSGITGAIVLTKGTRSLSRQTLNRIKQAFLPFRDRELVRFYDIMAIPQNLVAYERSQRLIIVVKKEDDNLRHLRALFDEQYPDLRERRWLIIDDEADFASVSFRRQNGTVNAG